MVGRRRYRDLLVAGGGDVDGGGGVERVVVGGGRAVVLGAAVDGQQVPVAVRSGWLDVFNAAVQTVLQAVVRLQKTRCCSVVYRYFTTISGDNFFVKFESVYI